MKNLERLQKVIAQAGVCSRRMAEQLIQAGKVTVNGKVVQELGVKVDPSKDRIRVNGEEIYIDDERVVIVFNKPSRVITTMSDPQNRVKVIDYIDLGYRVFPIGRLDYETEGLLLLTNDGELANKLMHPKYMVNKVYDVTIKGELKKEDLKALREGVKLADGITAPAHVRVISKLKNRRSVISITIYEGRKRQVRRMFKTLGYEIEKLKRTEYSFLDLGNLNSGEYRFLSKKEIDRLRELNNLV